MPTYYLNADTGNDSAPGDGSSSLPWLTIAKAHTSAASGDTIICQNSTAAYTFANQTFTKSLTIQGEKPNASGAVFDAASNTVLYAMGNSGLIMNFSNITFQNAVLSGSLFSVTTGNASVGTLVFNNCIFTKIRLTTGIRMSLFSTVSNWSNKTMTNTWNNCLFYDIIGRSGVTDAAIFEIYAGPASVFNILGCVFSLLDNSAEKLDKLFITGQGILNIKNTIIDVQRGSNLDWGAEGYLTTNITYSCLYLLDNAPALGAGSIIVNPLLVDPANKNFNLQLDSPAFNAGSN